MRLPWVLATCAILLWIPLIGGCRKKPSSPASPGATPVNTGKTTVKTITTPTGAEMVLIPGGEFVMGSPSGDDDEKPAHRVTIAGFHMDRYEVTQKSYQSLMGTNPSKFPEPTRPVERVSWTAAIKYCNMRSLKEGLTPCYNTATFECDYSANGYRLPTEAEWEYACRAGTTGAYSFGDNAASLATNGWCKANANQATHPVGQKQPNSWGLHDMHGNVAEWCNDRYSDKAYTQASVNNPRGPATGNERLLRGGSWRSTPEQCRSSARASETPGLADVCFGYEAYGFRCVKAAQ